MSIFLGIYFSKQTMDWLFNHEKILTGIWIVVVAVVIIWWLKERRNSK